MSKSKKSYRDTRVDFERDLNILMESIITGKRIIPHRYFRPNEGILKLKNTPNKRINLNTIDEETRSMAMGSTIENFLRYKNLIK